MTPKKLPRYCLALVPLVLMGCAGITAKSPLAVDAPTVPTRKDSSSFRVIDAHVHTDFAPPYTREAFFRELHDAGVSGAVSHTRENGRVGYEDLRAKGVIHCFGIADQFTKADQASLERGLSSGRFSCIKIYLGYIARYAKDAHYQPAYRLAKKYNVPVVFHTGDTYDRDGKLKYADPLTIDEVAVDHRKVTFVIAHCGNPWIESAAEVAYKNPNVYLEGSAFLIGAINEMPAEQIDEYLVKPLRWVFGYVEDPTKLMFGSDWPLAPIGQYLEAFRKAIPKEHWQAVFRDNALRVFPKLREVEIK